MRRRTSRERLARVALSALLVCAVTLVGAFVAVPAAYADNAQITIKDQDNTVDTSDYTKSLLVFKGTPSDNLNPTKIMAEDADWASDEVKNAVMVFLESQTTSNTGANQTYVQWLGAKNLLNTASASVYSDISSNTSDLEQFNKTYNVIAYLADELSNDNAQSPSYHTETTNPNVPHVAQSFAKELASALSSLATTPIEGGIFSANDSGYYLLWGGDAGVPIWLPYNAGGPNADIWAKVGVPTLQKLVQENGEGFVKITDAGMAETATFQITGTLNDNKMHNGVEFFDLLPSTLTLNAGSIKITEQVGGDTPVDVTDQFTISTTPGTDEGSGFAYTFKATSKDTVSFDAQNNTIVLVLTYDVTVNQSAGMGAAGIDTNQSLFKYGDGKYTTRSDASLVRFGIKIIKHGASQAILQGAKFTIQDVDSHSNTYQKYVQADGSMAAEPYVFTTNADGVLEAYKIDKGYYKISEVEAPEGYAKIDDFVLQISPDYDQFNGQLKGLGANILGWYRNSYSTTEGNATTYVNLNGADATTGIVTLTITDTKDEPRLPVTGMTPSQLGTIAGIVLVTVSAVALVHRSRAQQA